MRIPRLSRFCVVVTLLLSGCVNTAEKDHRLRLTQDPDWPRIRAVAVAEVLRQEGALGWSAISTIPEAVWPITHKDGVWAVGAAADYPLNTLGRIVTVEISDRGGALHYRRWAGHSGDKASTTDTHRALNGPSPARG